jgi:hypothetical protein
VWQDAGTFSQFIGDESKATHNNIIIIKERDSTGLGKYETIGESLRRNEMKPQRREWVSMK